VFRKYYVSFDTVKSIPKNGLPLPKDKEKHADNTMEYHYMMRKEDSDYIDVSTFNNKKHTLAEKYGLTLFGRAIDFLIFYNSVEPMSYIDEHSNFAGVYDLFDMTTSGLIGTTDKDEMDRLIGLYFRSEVAPFTPVVVALNPYMSERDIIDFIKKVYKSRIEPIQEQYRKDHIKLKDVRTKSSKKQERDDFIYKNRKLPITKLTSLVAQQFGKTFEYTYIQTIIRKEERKRK